jgi:lysophospholipase L1-like esterase
MINMYKSTWILCLIVLLGGIAGAQELKWDSTYRPKNYKAQVEKFRAAPHSKKDVVFLGNSITARTDWSMLLDLPNARNRGISGDISFGVLERLDEVISGKPAKVFLLIGINDISRNIPDSLVIGNISKIVDRIQKGAKRTKVFVYTLLPVNSSFGKFKNHYNKDEHILWVNDQIRKLAAKNVTVIDIYPDFLDAENRLRAELTNDGLHPNAAGYEIFKAKLKSGPYLK